MSYVSFLDMVGTRSNALISNEEYTRSIKDLHETMKAVATSLDGCKVYGYSDNAYIEVDNLGNMVLFLKNLRKHLMDKHRFFNAAVGKGELKQKIITIPANKGSSMSFTSPATVNIYMEQSKFTGIGVSLSQEVIDDLNKAQMTNSYCCSVYKEKEGDVFYSIYDLSYDPIGIEELNYMLSEYALTTIMSRRAGRYYVTPIVSMIRSLDLDTLKTQTDELIDTIMMKRISAALDTECIKEYSLLFLYALLGYTLSVEKSKGHLINSQRIFKCIIDMCGVEHHTITDNLSKAPIGIISNYEKKKLVQYMFAMYNES